MSTTTTTVTIVATITNGYNVVKCLEIFKSATSCDGPDQIDLAKFAVAYREFIKFFDFLGKVFGFVKSDLVDKLDIIEREIRQEKEQCDGINKHYVTIESTVEHEKSIGKNTATIAILRLMRGLDFIQRFLEGLYKNQETNKKPYELALAAYEQTLAFRHTWTVRQLVKAGLCILPTKKNLIVYMYTGVPASNSRVENDMIFQDMLTQCQKVYSGIHKLYEMNDFLELVPV